MFSTCDSTLDYPAGKDIADVRPVRDEIERRVRGLFAELGVPARALTNVNVVMKNRSD